MSKHIKADEVASWLEVQLLELQVDWMDSMVAGDVIMAQQHAAVMDGVYSFREYFLDIPTPAPGQGYEPPEEFYSQIVKERLVVQIDDAILTLSREREAILGPPTPTPATPDKPEPNPKDPEPEPVEPEPTEPEAPDAPVDPEPEDPEPDDEN
jgi:hypothetical protein